MLEKLMANPYAWAIISFIAIASFIYAIVCQHKNKEKKEFSYRRQSNSLIVKKKSKFKKLSVAYDGQEIDDLTVSRFIIWNSGNKTLDKEDMVPSKELTIFTSEDQIILDTELVARTEDSNRFLIRVIDEHTVKIYFDYADKKDGIVLQNIHTGTKKDIKLDCKIKGGNPIKDTMPQKSPAKEIRDLLFGRLYAMFLMLGVLSMLAFLVVCSIAIFDSSVQSFFFQPISKLVSARTEAIIGALMSFVYCAMGSTIIIRHGKRLFNVGIPKELKKYVEFEKDD